jgi:ATP-dependent Clp protease adaptor protein ClpS
MMADQTTAKPKNQIKTQLKHPKQYQVLLHNDDFTPREFVVYVLEMVFHRGQELAFQIMWQAHQHGVAVVGSYSLQEAETKVDKAHEMAQQEGHPMICSLREL